MVLLAFNRKHGVDGATSILARCSINEGLK